MYMNLDMVLVMLSILYVHAELKLKLENIALSILQYPKIITFWKLNQIF